jgi:hypothetical protein
LRCAHVHEASLGDAGAAAALIGDHKVYYVRGQFDDDRDANGGVVGHSGFTHGRHDGDPG